MNQDTQKIYDIGIVGGGPAGYSASIYASRYKLSNIVFGKLVGGTITEAHKVCNYPGVSDISGLDLAMNFYNQAKDLGGEAVFENIVDIKKEEDYFVLITENKKGFKVKTILLSLGTTRNKLHLPREEYYLGKGLSYCVTCDGMFYKNKTAAVVGGSNAATMAADMLSEIASKVYLIYRGTELKGDQIWIDNVKKRENVEILYTTIVTELLGEQRLEKIKLSRKYNDSEYLNIDGIFVEIGSEPNADLSKTLGLDLDDKGYIKVSKDQSTNYEGVWAAGDCTDGSNGFRQVVTAASEGSIAANSIYTYLRNGSCNGNGY